MRVCTGDACPVIVTSGKCGACQRREDASRGTRQARGYDSAHDRLRATWAPLVAAGVVACRRGDSCRAASVVIGADESWDLGHPDTACPLPTAPEHRACNRATRTHAASVARR